MGFGKLGKGILKRSNPKNVVKHTIRTVTDPVGAAMESANVVGEDVDNLSGGRVLNGKPLVGRAAPPPPQAALPAPRPMQLSAGAQAIYDRMQARRQGGVPAAPVAQAQPAARRPVVIPNGGVAQQVVANAPTMLGMQQPQQGILTMADGGMVPHTANKSGSHKKNGKPC